jgi:hypothetical protein
MEGFCTIGPFFQDKRKNFENWQIVEFRETKQITDYIYTKAHLDGRIGYGI